MATYSGQILNDGMPVYYPVNGLPVSVTPDFDMKAIIATGVQTGTGFTSDPVTTGIVDTVNGQMLRDFADLWYNRFRIIPNRINVGNLTSQQIRPIELFNGYFTAINVTALDSSGLSGIDFDITVPLAFAPLESQHKNLTINTTGALDFNGYFELTVDDSKELYYLYVTGKRVLALPFKHNWSNKITERLAWLNSSSKSLDGIEQIIMLRDAPRRTLDYDFLLASNTISAARLRALFASLMHGWQARIFAVPIWSDATRLSVMAVAGNNQVFLDTAYFDYDAGTYVMLWKDEEHYELLEIDEVFSDHVTTTVNLTNTWQAGITIVMPARLAVVSPNIQGVKHTVDIDSVPVTCEILPEYTSSNRVVASAPVTYRSLPVLLTKNNYAASQDFSIQRRITRADSQLGLFSIEGVQPAPDSTNSFAFLFANHAQLANYYSWLDDRKGRYKAFWFATWSRDMELSTAVGAADTSIIIKSIGYSSLYFIDDAPAYNRRDIMIRLKNGTYFFRRITGAEFDEDTNTDVIDISSALGQIVSLSDIDRISFLIPSALKADAIEIVYESGNVAQSQVQIVDLYDSTI